jgi:hypothetical protein
MSILRRVLGPKVPREVAAAHPELYQRPVRLLVGAAVLLLISLLLPYWVLHLAAPQFPGGLRVVAFVDRLEGDVHELEGLNHYVGLGSFDDAATFERSIAVYSILGLAALVVAGTAIHSRWVLVLALPALLLPVVFVADLQYWLYRFGNDLDPAAPFASAVGPFTPPVFGRAEIAQFETLALPGWGLVLAVGASVLVAWALVLHRRAYKPLLDGLEGDA